MRHARHNPHHEQNAGGNHQGFRVAGHLLHQLLAHVLGAVLTGHHDGRRDREQQRRDLRHQTITDGQQGVDRQCFTGGQSMLDHADEKTTDDVDKQDQNAGDSIAFNEFGGTVHGAVEVRFAGHFFTAGAGLFLVNQTGVQVGVNRHLFAGHRIEGKAGAHLGDTARTFGHDHEVDDHQDDEHHNTHSVVTADHHVTERFDHLTGRFRAVMTFQQHHAGRGHVQRQAQ